MMGLFQSLELRERTILQYIYFARCECLFLLSKEGSSVMIDNNRFNPMSLLFFAFFDLAKARYTLGVKSTEVSGMSHNNKFIIGKRFAFMKTCARVNFKDVLGSIKEIQSVFEEAKQHLGITKNFRRNCLYLKQLRQDLISEYQSSGLT